MEIIEFDEIRIGLMPIDTGVPLTRRERERAVVKDILNSMLGPDIVLSHNQDGAPIINRDGHISISHSQKLAVVAVAPYPIGIDAEEWRQALNRVKSRFLNDIEQKWINIDLDLLKAWTTKEAVYKIAGIRLLTGPEINISTDFESASVQGTSYQLLHFSFHDTQLTIARENLSKISIKC